MEVITIDSEAFQSLKEQLNRIESYIERSTTLSKEIDDTLELSSKDVMEALAISESTLYRWRKKGIIRYRYAESGDVRYFYNSLFVGIKCYQIKVPAMPKEEAVVWARRSPAKVMRISPGARPAFPRASEAASFCMVLSAASQVSHPNIGSSQIRSNLSPRGPSPSFFPTTDAQLAI